MCSFNTTIVETFRSSGKNNAPMFVISIALAFFMAPFCFGVEISADTTYDTTQSYQTIYFKADSIKLINNSTITGSGSGSGSDVKIYLNDCGKVISSCTTSVRNSVELYNYGTIQGSVYFSSASSVGEAGNIDSIVYNYGTITGSITDQAAQQKANNNTLYNYGTITKGVKLNGTTSAASGDTGNGFKLYNTGTIGLYSEAGVIYHLWLGNTYTNMSDSYVSPTIYSYHNIITESTDTFNSFTTYSSQSDDITEDTSHLVIRKNTLSSCSDDESCLYNVRFDNDFKMYLSIREQDVNDGKVKIYTGGELTGDYLYYVSKLILDEEGNSYTMYDTDDALIFDEDDPDSFYDTIANALQYTGDELDLVYLGITNENCGDDLGYCFYFAMITHENNENKISKSIANTWHTGNIQTLHVLHSHVKHGTFGIHNREYFRNAYLRDNQQERISVLEGSKNRYFYGASAYTTSANEILEKRRDMGVKRLGKDKKSNQDVKSQDSLVDSSETITESSEDSIEAVLYLTQAPEVKDDYYFFFSPFTTYNNFKVGQKLDGYNYGFISGFNAKLGDSNTLGLHLGAIYGNLSNSGTKAIDITTLTLALGLHYKLDFSYGLFLKTYLEGYAFMNDVEYVPYGVSQSPNNFGGGASVYFGKDFDFDNAGVLGLELGIIYWGLQSQKMDFNSVSVGYYDDIFFNLLYADVGVNYAKVFSSGLGLSAEVGARFLLNDVTYDFTYYGCRYANNKVTTDEILGYGGIGVSYFVNPNIELGVQYLGHFGDKSMSHSGFFNVRVWW